MSRKPERSWAIRRIASIALKDLYDQGGELALQDMSRKKPLVNNRVEPQVEEAVAREIAVRSPLAIWGTKEMINYARDHSTEDALNYIATWQTGMFQPKDMAESFAAKRDGREPEFDDLLPIREPI